MDRGGDETAAPGRSYLLHCRYRPEQFAVPAIAPLCQLDVLYLDAAAWQDRFLRQWPAGSDAHASCFSRITGGPSCRLDEALRIEE